MREQIQARLEELRAELNNAGRRLQQLEQEEAQTRELALRLAGAVQVLTELLSDSPPQARTNGALPHERPAASERQGQPVPA